MNANTLKQLIAKLSTYSLYVTATLLVLAIVFYFLSNNKKKCLKTIITVAVVYFLALAIIFTALAIWRYILKGEFFAFEKTNSSSYLLYVFTAVIMVICTIFIILDKNKLTYTSKELAFGGICLSLAFGLSFIKLFSLPQGGSVTFASMLPIMIFSYRYGVKKGFILGIVYGFLQFMQAPIIYHPIQFLLDYPLAFACLSLAGGVKNLKANDGVKILLGILFGAIMRYLCHVISGVFIFGSGDANYSAVGWSLVYNAFTLVDALITEVVALILTKSKQLKRLLDV